MMQEIGGNSRESLASVVSTCTASWKENAYPFSKSLASEDNSCIIANGYVYYLLPWFHQRQETMHHKEPTGIVGYRLGFEARTRSSKAHCVVC
ncbi:hypothetical protein M413DRAFT_276016 [Hebeloma cylindrosporum]|uniref:Uncharacterized protein n=1 Tax=Hebeloma cylindrosporum TaxID=76867 RepID=A0A0C3BYY0_HEBCY|nr:hypothetical protein M413DRAFT_276016 [Hebeloma cylindrosporum h7]